MANMSYCQFENTLTDLTQCVKTIEEALEQGTLQREFLKGLSSEYERQAYKDLAVQCMKFLDAYDELGETELDEESGEDERNRRCDEIA
jgi:hypothetical protein